MLYAATSNHRGGVNSASTSLDVTMGRVVGMLVSSSTIFQLPNGNHICVDLILDEDHLCAPWGRVAGKQVGEWVHVGRSWWLTAKFESGQAATSGGFRKADHMPALGPVRTWRPASSSYPDQPEYLTFGPSPKTRPSLVNGLATLASVLPTSSL